MTEDKDRLGSLLASLAVGHYVRADGDSDEGERSAASVMEGEQASGLARRGCAGSADPGV